MKSLHSILPVFTNATNTNSKWKLKLIKEWDTIMGSLASKVTVHKVYDNAITLAVCDSSWMQELYLMSELIKKKLNSYLKQPRIKKIHLKQLHKKQHVQKKEKAVPSLVSKRKLSIREQKALERIQDPELSLALRRFLQRCHQSS